VLIRTPAGPSTASKKPHRLKAELRVPSSWKGYSILVRSWRFGPGELDRCYEDGGAEPDRQTLVGMRSVEIVIHDGLGSDLRARPWAQTTSGGLRTQDASVVLDLEPS
jgi:hypothetical protein